MKTFTLINLMLNLICTIEADTLSEAKGRAIDLANTDHSDNDAAYWIKRRDYHNTENFTDVSRVTTYTVIIRDDANVCVYLGALETNKGIDAVIIARDWSDFMLNYSAGHVPNMGNVTQGNSRNGKATTVNGFTIECIPHSRSK